MDTVDNMLYDLSVIYLPTSFLSLLSSFPVPYILGFDPDIKSLFSLYTVLGHVFRQSQSFSSQSYYLGFGHLHVLGTDDSKLSKQGLFFSLIS